MALTETTILPTDEPDVARRLFSELIYEEPYVLLVVQGTGADAEALVRRADKLASEPRWIVWARSREVIAPVRDALRVSADLQEHLASSRAFSLSMSDEVRDVIRADEPVPDMVRILEAFINAERGLP